MKVQVAKWGNSSAVRLPKQVVDELGLRPGTRLDLEVQDGELRLRPQRRTSRELLQELVAEAARIGWENQPELVDWGPDRGSEILEEDEYSRGEVTLEDLLKAKRAPKCR